MTNLLVVCIVSSILVSSASLADENIVLFSSGFADGNKLYVQLGDVSVFKSLKLNFYQGRLNNGSSEYYEVPGGNKEYLKYFSNSEKKECINYQQVAVNIYDVLKFCVNIENSFWFGGPQRTYQYWPLNKFNWTDESYVTKENNSQAIVESYFFNSDGFYIYIDEAVALFVDINGPQPGQMCFTAKVNEPYRKSRNFMQFRVCKYNDPRLAHENAIKDVLGMPTSMPDHYLVETPIWSTWARYHVDVNSSIVLKYAREIVENNYPRGTLEIDDLWETCYGSFEFNRTRFENIKELVKQLKTIGFKTSLWVHPFINLDCPIHEEAYSKGYLVNSTKTSINSTWWNGNGSYVDFTNPEAANWWSNRLHDLIAVSGIDTLKFDAGESSWSPQLPVFYDQNLTYYPDNIVNAYLKTAVTFGGGIEYRSSRRSQKFGRFLRMMDRESRWDYKLGLPTLITSVIQMNMIGYPFVLPDMIGGNAYDNKPPIKEMYIRWMQANTFMPAVQFSYTPWDFDMETIVICKYFMDLRSKYTDTIIRAMRDSVTNGSPVNPPIWWIDPTNTEAHTIDDEYLLGENILVAPVLKNNARSRDVYLPAGSWRDENDPKKAIILGRKWINNYSASLGVLPWFTRVSSDENITSSSTSLVSGRSYILAFGLILYYLF